MTHAEFDNFQDTLLDEVVEIKNTKGVEYANGEDRFGNFRRLSLSLGLTPEQVGWVYLAKHLDSLQSYIRIGQTFSNESIRSRFVDAITYLTLIAGMVEERFNDESKPKDQINESILITKNSGY